MFDLKPKISTEYFWKHIDQESAMFSITLHSIGDRFVNPFRQNRSANTEILKNNKGRLIFQDFGDSSFQQLDIITLLMKVRSIAYEEAKTQLWDDFVKTKKLDRALNGIPEQTPRKIKEPKKYISEDRKWLSYDTEYWEQYGLTKEDCINGGLRPVSFFYHQREDGEASTVKYNSPESPIYMWVINEKKKFYLPLANKYEKRFISTFNNNDLYYKDDFSSDTLFIGSSWKDITVVKKASGFAVRGLQSETISPPESLLEDIKRFKKVIISFDSDEEGCKANYRFYTAISKVHDNVEVWYLNNTFKDYAEFKQNGMLWKTYLVKRLKSY